MCLINTKLLILAFKKSLFFINLQLKLKKCQKTNSE